MYVPHEVYVLGTPSCLLMYAIMYMFTYPHTHTTIIAGCVVPEPPVNGDWQTFSPSTAVGPGTSLSLSCICARVCRHRVEN